jgi:sec-independent protein translocase protein TatA
MSLSFGKLILIFLIVLLLFGAGRIPRLMADLGKGMRALREGLKEEEAPQAKLSNKDDASV